MKLNSNLECVTFSSEKKRQAHVSVKCLPYSVWSSWDLFFKEIPRAVIQIMQASDFEEAIQFVQHLPESHTNTQRSRWIIWLAIALSHPTLPVESMLSDLAQILQLQESDLLKLTIICGNHDYLDYLISRNQLDDCWYRFFDQNKNDLIGLAAKHGHIRLLDRLCLFLDDEHAVENALVAQNYQIVMDAAQYGHVHVLQYFMANVSPQHCMNAMAVHHYMPYRLAAKEGQVPVLAYFNELLPQRTALMCSMFYFEAFLWAACNGHIAVLRYWVNTTMFADQLKRLLTVNASSIFLSNLRRHDLNMIKFLFDSIDEQDLIFCLKSLYPGILTAPFVSLEPEYREMLPYLRQLLNRHGCDASSISDRAIYLASISQKAYDVVRYYTTILSPRDLEQGLREAPEKLEDFLNGAASNHVIVFLLSFPEFWTEVVCQHKNNSIVISAILSRTKELRHMVDELGELPLMSERENKANYFLTCYCLGSSNPSLSREVDFLLTIPAVEKEVMHSPDPEGEFFQTPSLLHDLKSRLLAKSDRKLSTQTMFEKMQPGNGVLTPTPPQHLNTSICPRSFVMSINSICPLSSMPSTHLLESVRTPVQPTLLRPKAVYSRQNAYTTVDIVDEASEETRTELAM